MKTLKNQKGLSLIEVTIMLLVLMLLTGVLAPSIFDFVKDAQWVKVKEDCEAIALTVARLHRDVGCMVRTAGGTTTGQLAKCLHNPAAGYIPAVLRGDGPTPDIVDGTAAATSLGTYNAATEMNWNSSVYDSMSNQFVTNTPNYVEPPAGPASPFGPFFNKGWRGAYLSAPIGPDPFGSPYLVNSAFLDVAATNAAGEGQHNWDTFCISAGPNRKFETLFQQKGAIASGDDFITIISGGTY